MVTVHALTHTQHSRHEVQDDESEQKSGGSSESIHPARSRKSVSYSSVVVGGDDWNYKDLPGSILKPGFSLPRVKTDKKL